MGGTFSRSREAPPPQWQCGLGDSRRNTPQPPPAKVNAILLGNSGIGAKTSLLTRLIEDKFTDVFISTIGIDYRIYRPNIPYMGRFYEPHFRKFLMSQRSSSVPVLPEGILQLIHSHLRCNATWDCGMTIWDVAGADTRFLTHYIGKVS